MNHQDQARLQAAIEYIESAQAANERGRQMDVSRLLLKVEECVRRTLINSAPVSQVSAQAIGASR